MEFFELLDQHFQELAVGAALNVVGGHVLRGDNLFFVRCAHHLVEGVVGLDYLLLVFLRQYDVLTGSILLVLFAQFSQVGVDCVLVLVLLHFEGPVARLPLRELALGSFFLFFLLFFLFDGMLALDVQVEIGLLAEYLAALLAVELICEFFGFDVGSFLSGVRITSIGFDDFKYIISLFK